MIAAVPIVDGIFCTIDTFGSGFSYYLYWCSKTQKVYWVWHKDI